MRESGGRGKFEWPPREMTDVAHHLLLSSFMEIFDPYILRAEPDHIVFSTHLDWIPVVLLAVLGWKRPWRTNILDLASSLSLVFRSSMKEGKRLYDRLLLYRVDLAITRDEPAFWTRLASNFPRTGLPGSNSRVIARPSTEWRVTNNIWPGRVLLYMPETH